MVQLDALLVEEGHNRSEVIDVVLILLCADVTIQYHLLIGALLNGKSIPV